MPNKKIILFFLITLLFLVGCKENHSCVYDDQSKALKCSEASYQTVQINGKIWLAENLKWPVVDSSFCYGNEYQNCNKYGRLYTWGASMGKMYPTSTNTLRGLCPNGWHVPTPQEFQEALNSAEKDKLKILHAGFRYDNDSYVDENRSASFWTSSEFDSSRAYLLRISDEGTTLEHYNKTIASSVRCVMD